LPTNLSVTVDPAVVLGVGLDASLQEIRDAYRTKAKRHHPDAGGEEWVFRILVACYEALGTERVARASARESEYVRRRPSTSPAPETPRRPAQGFSATTPPRPEAGPRSDPGDNHETLREGDRDEAADPSRVVDVEKLTLRFQLDHVWVISEHGSEDRTLSCSLNVNWPDPELDAPLESIAGREDILTSLQAGFDEVAAETQADSTRTEVVDGRFSGWVSYPGNARGTKALERLNSMLRGIGLSVHQRSREVILPRQASGGRRGR
jgi:DnaJ domain